MTSTLIYELWVFFRKWSILNFSMNIDKWLNLSILKRVWLTSEHIKMFSSLCSTRWKQKTAFKKLFWVRNSHFLKKFRKKAIFEKNQNVKITPLHDDTSETNSEFLFLAWKNPYIWPFWPRYRLASNFVTHKTHVQKNIFIKIFSICCWSFKPNIHF